MRRTLSRALGAVVLLAFLPLVAAMPGHAATPTWHSWDPGLQEAGSAGRPVLVDVYTDWCGWCKRMDREVYSRRDVQDYLARKFVVVRLNAESNEVARYEGRTYSSRALAARFGVNGYPTTIFLGSDGNYLGNVPGYTPADRFLLLLRFVGDGHMSRGESFEDFARGAQGGTSDGVKSTRR
jgi:thioredoxin-related protein